jgi:hypothetical protein
MQDVVLIRVAKTLLLIVMTLKYFKQYSGVTT